MGYEDFTTYDETDPQASLSKTASRCTYSSSTRNEIAHISDSKGAAAFGGDFEHWMEVYPDSTDVAGFINFWVLANSQNHYSGTDPALMCGFFVAAGPQMQIDLREIDGGLQNRDTADVNNQTQYWLKIIRDSGLGAEGTLFCFIYSDASRSTLVDTLSFACSDTETFEYVYGAQSLDDNKSDTMSGWVQNLELQEASLWFPFSIHNYQGAF